MAANDSKAAKRLQKELMELMMSDIQGISAFPDNDNLFQWIATVQGADQTVYEGLEFQLLLKFSQNYPFDAPVVSFITPCYHPNVDTHGTICLDTLKENWSAINTASTVLLSIQSLLDNPNIHSPLNSHAAAMWKDPVEYRKAVLLMYESKKSVPTISA
jgi:ubiquitin-conjugating enzyme E2 C